MKNHLNTSNLSSSKQNKDKRLIPQLIARQIEKGTGFNISELKEKYTEDKLFAIALRYVTTTKKALCTALNIPIEAGCRYKRTLEKEGRLVQSVDEVICPLTRHEAHLISTNPAEFERLLKSDTTQLNLFE